MQVSVKETAAMLGIKENTLRQQIFRGVHHGKFFLVVDGKQVADLDEIKAYCRNPRKERHVKVYFTKREYRRIKEESGELTLSEYIRQRFLEAK